MYQFAVKRFENFQQSARNSYTAALSNLQSTDMFNQGSGKDAISFLSDQLDIFIQSRDSIWWIERPIFYFEAYYGLLDEYEGDSLLPTTKRDGTEWGFLGWMTYYLIQTQSTEMVLLIGMIGFGLLGASILSFQKLPSNSNFIDEFSQTPLIKDMGSVLARGFGATLVVYLATKGGLAIFSMGGTPGDPNEYILLLTCFIAAVYSEKLWVKIANAFSNSGQHNTVNSNQVNAGHV